MALSPIRCRLTKVLAGATRGEKGSKSGGGRVRLWELVGFKDKLIYHFVLAADMIGGGGGSIREFVNDKDGPAFLERELMGLGVDGYR